MKFVIAVAVLFAAPTVAHADLRSFTRTYEYATMPAGKTAIELWHTQGRQTWDSGSPELYQGILELEHGITDRWDVAFYTVLEQVGGDVMTAESLHLGEIKLETRYRLAERGEWPVDTLLYFEVAKGFDASVYEVEGKLIGARDFGALTAVLNLISEVKFGNDTPETELELGWATGVTYQAHPKLRLGAESWGAIEDSEVAASLGPAISIAPAPDFWVALTAGFGLTDEADAFSARAIFGIEL